MIDPAREYHAGTHPYTDIGYGCSDGGYLDGDGRTDDHFAAIGCGLGDAYGGSDYYLLVPPEACRD